MTQTSTEYNALDFDGTERRANYRTVAYRIDILHLCERKDAAAILFEIIYRWQTEVRKPEITKEIERRKKANLPALTEEEVESMMWVWMSYNEFVRESGGAVAYNTVIRMLDYLVEDAKIVECRENHDPRYPDYEYRIRLDMVKAKLKALPAAPAFLPKVPKKKDKKSEDSTQVGISQKRSTQKGRRAQKSTQIGIVSTQEGRATTQNGREVYPDGGTSHTTHIPSHIQPTEESTYSERESETAASGAVAPTHAPLSQFFDEAIESAKRAGALPATSSQGEAHATTPDRPGLPDRAGTQHGADLDDSLASDRQGAGGDGRAAEAETRSQVSAKVEQATLLVIPPQQSAKAEIPDMPPISAKWCPETLVQIVEAKHKKRYREAAREKQIAAARRILREDPELSRERFVLAYDERDDDWWHDHKGLLHVNHMAEKDRVHEMLDRIDVRNARASSGSPANQHNQQNVRASSPTTAGYQPLTPEEIQRNKDRLHAKRAARLAAQSAVTQVAM